MSLTPVLTKRFGTDQPWKIANYERLDGYAGLRKALTMPADDVIALVKDSNLRGRGGAGFPTGLKWQFIPQPKKGEPVKPHYVVINADEGEPGTCRDLPLMMNDPHSMIEGIIIACYAVRANHAFVYIRGEAAARHPPGDRRRSNEAYAKPASWAMNVLGTGIRCRHHRARRSRRLHLRRRDGAARLARGLAAASPGSSRRSRRPTGLYDAPTVVNNVGSLIATVPYIVNCGGGLVQEIAANTDTPWASGSRPTERRLGPRLHGSCIYSLSGRVKNPGQYEAPMGTTLA